jgi:hypothetical protein
MRYFSELLLFVFTGTVFSRSVKPFLAKNLETAVSCVPELVEPSEEEENSV